MWVAFSHCEYFLPGRWNSTDLVNRSLYCRCLPPFYLKSHLFASYERPSCAHSTLVYLYGGSIEMSVNRRCLLFTIILKSVSSSVNPTTFLILVILYDLQFPLSLSFLLSFALISRHFGIRNSENGNIRICMDAAKRWVNQSSLVHLRECDAAKNNGRCMSNWHDFIVERDILAICIRSAPQKRDKLLSSYIKMIYHCNLKASTYYASIPKHILAATTARRKDKVKRENRVRWKWMIILTIRIFERHVALIIHAMFSPLKSQTGSSMTINDAGAVRL